MQEIQVYMTDKQIDYVKKHAGIKKVTFNEALRQIIDEFLKSKRETEIEKAREGFR